MHEQTAGPEPAASDTASDDAASGGFGHILWRKKTEISSSADGDDDGTAGEDADWHALYLAEQIKADDYLDKWRRSTADMANMRRRHDQDRLETIRQANAALLKAILPVLDSFERAVALAPAEGEEQNWASGVLQIERQLHVVLEREGMARIEAIGKPFDPNEHEALVQEESDLPEDTVTGELQRGYRLHDRVLRPAMVKVAVPTDNKNTAARSTMTEE